MEYMIVNAEKRMARDIARLIMMAMNHDCCKYFMGIGHTLEEFKDMMTSLVEREDSQYSFLNTLAATDNNGNVIGICVSYDGAELHRLRKAFVESVKACFGRDFSNMDDETGAGELYLDSLAVDVKHRNKGVASALLKASISKADALGISSTGLLVDKGNPSAERLYTALGFEYVEDSAWGGHPMKHFQFKRK